MRIVAVVVCIFVWTTSCINRATSTADDFCQSQTFQPRCLPGEAVIITKAVYGRMSHDSRCLQDEEILPALRDDPRHMGCFENVLEFVSARCSGQPRCEIRIPDPELDKTNPCYRYTVKYLEADYQCIRTVQPDRSCQVAVTSEKIFLSPFTSDNASTATAATCGSRERPWLLEAPSGQRINISLLDFSGSSSTSSAHRARTVETASSSGCQRQFGFIDDKSANRNINICTDAAHRQPTLYVSRSNQLDIVLTSRQQTPGNFLISVKAVGCSDLVPPNDAWLKRSDNVATVGCYMTRQTWILTCDHTGRWTGTFGNCTQQLLAIQGNDVVIQPAESRQQSQNFHVIILVAITGVSCLVCVIIISVGVTWLCRLKTKKSCGPRYGDDDLMTSLDVKTVECNTMNTARRQ